MDDLTPPHWGTEEMPHQMTDEYISAMTERLETYEDVPVSEIAAALTALRAQLAEAWAKLSQRVDMHECAMAERDDATLYGVEQKARADRAEAALAAQIEAADALGYTCTGCGHLCGDPDKDMKTLQRAGSISCCPERKMVPLSQAITHDPAKVAALVEAASALERNLGINGVNVGSLRVNLFAALAAWKEAPK